MCIHRWRNVSMAKLPQRSNPCGCYDTLTNNYIMAVQRGIISIPKIFSIDIKNTYILLFHFDILFQK